jgi:hypothetical protein
LLPCCSLSFFRLSEWAYCPYTVSEGLAVQAIALRAYFFRPSTFANQLSVIDALRFSANQLITDY